MYTNIVGLKLGTCAIVQEEDVLENAVQHFRSKIQSDHLMMYTWMKFSPMKSLRSPMIQKEKMMQKMRLASKRTLRDLRCDFFNVFLMMRN